MGKSRIGSDNDWTTFSLKLLLLVVLKENRLVPGEKEKIC